jgi:hypothetical protein
MSIYHYSNFKFKLVFKKGEIPSHIKKFADEATANLVQIHCKFIMSIDHSTLQNLQPY